MLDFSFIDPRLLFPDITESLAAAIENVLYLIEFISLIIMAIGEWKLFRKFGEKPWKSFVPFYNTYITYKHTWSIKAFWAYISTSVIFNIAQNASKTLAQNSPDTGWHTLVILLAFPFGIVAATCSILYAFRLAEAFGKGKLFSVGLMIFYPVFIAILGFGKCRYIGAFGENAEAEGEDVSRAEREVI